MFNLQFSKFSISLRPYIKDTDLFSLRINWHASKKSASVRFTWDRYFSLHEKWCLFKYTCFWVLYCVSRCWFWDKCTYICAFSHTLSAADIQASYLQLSHCIVIETTSDIWAQWYLISYPVLVVCIHSYTCSWRENYQWKEWYFWQR